MSGTSESTARRLTIGASIAGILGLVVAVCALGRDYFNWSAEGAAAPPDTGTIVSPARQSPPGPPAGPSAPADAAATPVAPSTGRPTTARTPADPPSTRRPSPTHAGPLVITVELCCQSGKIGPSTWKNRSTVSAGIEVFDSTGALDRGCYAKWTLLRDAEVIEISNSYCRSHGITPWGRQSLQPGEYTLQTEVTTDWNLTGVRRTPFTVAA